MTLHPETLMPHLPPPQSWFSWGSLFSFVSPQPWPLLLDMMMAARWV